MNDASMEILAAAIGVVAVGALGVLITNHKNIPATVKQWVQPAGSENLKDYFLLKTSWYRIAKGWIVI